MGSMRKSLLSQHTQRLLIDYFVSGITARIAARFCGIHRDTAAHYSLRLHEITAYELEAESNALSGRKNKVHESYFAR